MLQNSQNLDYYVDHGTSFGTWKEVPWSNKLSFRTWFFFFVGPSILPLGRRSHEPNTKKIFRSWFSFRSLQICSATPLAVSSSCCRQAFCPDGQICNIWITLNENNGRSITLSDIELRSKHAWSIDCFVARTWTIAFDSTFGSFTLLELVSCLVNWFLWWKCLDCLNRNRCFFGCLECWQRR